MGESEKRTIVPKNILSQTCTRTTDEGIVYVYLQMLQI